MPKRRLLPIALLMFGCPTDDPAIDTSTDTDDSADSTTAGPGPTTMTPTITGPPTDPDVTGEVSSATGDSSSTTGPSCTEDQDCGANAPFCIEDQCVPCGLTPTPDDACAGFGDGSTPLCNDDQCVQCTERDPGLCAGATPICDTAQNACVGCTFHEQCPDSACHIAQGNCIAEDSVFYVDGDAAACGAGNGSEAQPYCTINEALDDITGGQSGVVIIAPRAAGVPYIEVLDIDNGRTIALLGGGGGRPVLSATLETTLTVITGASTAYLQDLQISGNADAVSLRIDTASVFGDRTEIIQNPAGGIELVGGGHLQLRNSVVGINGNQFSDTYGINADGASTLDVLYSTIAANDGNAAAVSLVCAGGAGGEVRNSIVAGADADSIDCDGAEFNNTAVDTTGLDGMDIVELGVFNPAWFVNVGAGDFHLASPTTSPFADVATWSLGDPPTDIDGEDRPDQDDTPDFAGADEPPPPE